jgi:hypothetical protein
MELKKKISQMEWDNKWAHKHLLMKRKTIEDEKIDLKRKIND